MGEQRPDLPWAAAGTFAADSVPPEVPIACVDLTLEPDSPCDLVLPPYPLVGVGPSDHPLAARMDAVVEAASDSARLVRQVAASPNAASVLVQLLRLLPGLPLEQGLVAESMAYALLQGSGEHLRWRAARPARAPRAEPGCVEMRRSGSTLEIVLASPDAGNAIDRATRDALHEALSLAAIDPEIAAVRLGARGKAFSLGAELSEFGTTTDPATAHAIRLRTLPAWAALGCADKLSVHVEGACIGAGLELAGFARRITASPSAWFQLPELSMGILPGAGGCVSLTHRIGRQRTALLVLSGRRLRAREALAWGLIDAIVDEMSPVPDGADVI